MEDLKEAVVEQQTEQKKDKEEKKREKLEKKREKKEKKNKADKPKKKLKKRWIFGGIAALLVILIVVNSVRNGNAAPVVYTAPAALQDLEQTISTSGTVKSDETETYYAPVAVKIGEVNVSAGDMVKAGDVLIAYDETALADAKKQAELKLQSNDGGYESSVAKDNKYIAELGEANVNLDVLKQQIEDCENYVKELNKKVSDKQAALAREGALLQISLIDWSDKPDSEEYENLQKLIQLNSYEQQNNQEVRAWKEEISEYEDKIAAYKEYKSEMESQKKSSESGYLDQGGKSKLEADKELEDMNNTNTLTAIDTVENGIVADFDGVVTSVDTEKNATPAEGTKLLTLESVEKVKVCISVSKYDLEKIVIGQKADIDIAGKKYEGELTKIDGMATNNASGAAVVGAEITITNPDDKIYLGVEAKIELHTASVADAVVVPLEAVNADKDGDFVYAVENGMVVKKRITTGISSDEYTEIKEGLSEGDSVITVTDMDLMEGMAVTEIPQE
jgi:HlyD family secretion protein